MLKTVKKKKIQVMTLLIPSLWNFIETDHNWHWSALLSCDVQNICLPSALGSKVFNLSNKKKKEIAIITTSSDDGHVMWPVLQLHAPIGSGISSCCTV